MKGRVLIGTSGFTYKSWNAAFYPKEIPQRLQLEYYASQFPTVEINATFYRLPTENMVRGWAKRVPADFSYALKGSRFITHMKKLANLDGGLDNYFVRVHPMKRRVGIILWQLPPMLQKDIPRLDAFLKQLRTYRYRHAVEFRHRSWYEDDEALELLRKHKTAHACLSTLNMPMNLTVTSDQVYIRFHGLEGGFAHDYTRAELEPWAKFCREQAAAGRAVYAYFNNDVNVRAPQNAKMLMEMTEPYSVKASGAFEFTPGRRSAKTSRSLRSRSGR
jgi:uncharacterized protein YecE (DUF72 family)